MAASALTVARAFAREVARQEGGKVYPQDKYGPRVRNRAETQAHGWMPDALATVCYESSSADLIELVGSRDFSQDGFYVEPYSSWLVGVFKL